MVTFDDGIVAIMRLDFCHCVSKATFHGHFAQKISFVAREIGFSDNCIRNRNHQKAYLPNDEIY